MESELIFAVVIFLFGLSSVIFAKPLGIRQYNYNLRRRILLRFGVKFIVGYFRIVGINMIVIAIFFLMLWYIK